MTPDVSYNKNVEYYLKEIDFYEKKFKKWTGRADKIVKRYTDERDDHSTKSQFNILWSNTQTLAPAVYSQAPKPNIERRFQDDDELGIIASRVLERGTSYYVDSDEFDYSMKQLVLDYLLVGRGQSWVRYLPTFNTVKEDVGEEIEGAQVSEDIADEELEYEDVVVDYVHWKDFGHSWARTWEETRMVWRKVHMAKAEVKTRFGEEVADKVDFITQDGDEIIRKKACIYEVWDKVAAKVCWVCRDCPQELDELDDPLGLTGFFPCPKPLYSTVSNDSLIPTPFYVQYQDQAMELDELTARIQGVTGSIRVAGVFDSSVQGLESILTSGYDDKLVPVESWAMFAEKGGLKGTIDFIPMQEIVQTLLSLYDARERVKQDLYEITGISDIVRGSSKPNETATAQRIKGQFASLRLDAMSAEVQRFGRDLVRLITEIVAEHFSPETIKKLSGIKLLSEQEKQMLQGQMQQAQQMAQQIPEGAPPPPMPDEDQVTLLEKPTWEDVIALINDDMARSFRISIETDSTIKGDQEADKQSRIEFLTAVSTFMEKSVMLPPELQPLAGEMLMFGVRGFKIGRELEQTMKASLESMKKKAEQPPQEQPNPEAEKAKAQMQIEGQKLQQNGQIKTQELQQKAQSEQQKTVAGHQSDVAKLQGQQVIEQMKSQTAVQIKQMELDSQAQIERMKLEAAIQMDSIKENTVQREVKDTQQNDQAITQLMHGQKAMIEALGQIVQSNSAN